MRTFLFLTVFAALFCGSACADKKALPTIDNTSWQLKKMIEGSTTQLIPADVTISANFKTGTLSGKGGCNTYSAPYTSSGNRLSFGAVMSTKMFCPANNWEVKYFNALHGEMSWTISGNTLTLQGTEVSLVYEKS